MSLKNFHFKGLKFGARTIALKVHSFITIYTGNSFIRRAASAIAEDKSLII
jgi:hypothetical protein